MPRSSAKIESDKRYRQTEKYKERWRNRRRTPKYKAFAKKMRAAYYLKNKEKEKAVKAAWRKLNKLVRERLANLPPVPSENYESLLE